MPSSASIVRSSFRFWWEAFLLITICCTCVTRASLIDLSEWIEDNGDYTPTHSRALCFLATGDQTINYIPALLTAAYSFVRQNRNVDIVVLTDEKNRGLIRQSLRHLKMGTAAYSLSLKMPFFGEGKEAEWCPVEGEFLHINAQKLIITGMIEYEAIIYMDLDAILFEGANEIFNIDGIYRGIPGPCSPVNGGWFVLKPSAELFDKFVRAIKGRFTEQEGWVALNTGPVQRWLEMNRPGAVCPFELAQYGSELSEIPWSFYGSCTDQGLLHALFNQPDMKNSSRIEVCGASTCPTHYAGSPKPWEMSHDWHHVLKTRAHRIKRMDMWHSMFSEMVHVFPTMKSIPTISDLFEVAPVVGEFQKIESRDNKQLRFIEFPRGDADHKSLNPCLFSVQKYMACLPSFYVLGVQKSGTTDVYDRINLHPDVVNPKRKEPHFWDQHAQYNETEHFNTYIENFDPLVDELNNNSESVNVKITGDGTASTFYLHKRPFERRSAETFHTPRLIREATPDAKIILMFREPIARLFSEFHFYWIAQLAHWDLPNAKEIINSDQSRKRCADRASWQMERKYGPGPTPLLFDKMVDLKLDLWRDCVRRHGEAYCLYDDQFSEDPGNLCPQLALGIGMYSEFAPHWLAHFPPEQIMIMHAEDLKYNMKDTLQKVFDFLSLREPTDEEWKNIIEHETSNKHDYHDILGVDVTMLPETEKKLRDFFDPYNKKLDEVLGMDYTASWYED